MGAGTQGASFKNWGHRRSQVVVPLHATEEYDGTSWTAGKCFTSCTSKLVQQQELKRMLWFLEDPRQQQDILLLWVMMEPIGPHDLLWVQLETIAAGTGATGAAALCVAGLLYQESNWDPTCRRIHRSNNCRERSLNNHNKLAIDL